MTRSLPSALFSALFPHFLQHSCNVPRTVHRIFPASHPPKSVTPPSTFPKYHANPRIIVTRLVLRRQVASPTHAHLRPPSEGQVLVPVLLFSFSRHLMPHPPSPPRPLLPTPERPSFLLASPAFSTLPCSPAKHPDLHASKGMMAGWL